MPENKTFQQWMKDIKDFKGGGHGFLVVLVTLIATGYGGWYGLALFPDGSYPKLVLALPGLACGGIAFLIGAAITFKLREAKSE